MDFDLSPQQTALQRSIRASDSWQDPWATCIRLGLTGLPAPAEHGGGDAGMVTCVAAMEALGRVCPDRGFLLSLTSHLWGALIPLRLFAGREQRERYLPGLCSGQRHGLGSISPEDIVCPGIHLQAIEDHLVINGSACLMAGDRAADLIVVYASAGPDYGGLGVSALIVDNFLLETERFLLEADPCGLLRVTFENCAIPGENLLGPAGRGADLHCAARAWALGCLPGLGLGLLQQQLDSGLDRGSLSGSREIVERQRVLEAARLLVYKAAWLHDQGRNAQQAAALARLQIAIACERYLREEAQDPLVDWLAAGLSEAECEPLAGALFAARASGFPVVPRA